MSDSSSYFKVKKITNFDDLKVDDILPCSDFSSLTNNNKFVQLEYVENEAKVELVIVKPGLYAITKTAAGLKLIHTSFVKDKILETYSVTQKIVSLIDTFFQRQDAYKKHGIEVPMRSALLYGEGGTGKTSSAMLAVSKYLTEGKTAIVLWPTDQIDPYDVKEYVKRFQYQGAEKLITIVEDIGGVEVDQVRMKSTASLLSILDNKEKTFKIPTFLIATTNHPENFLGNITNRPGRFADKIHVKPPDAQGRKDLFVFYAKESATGSVLDKIALKKYNSFTADHIKEVVIRADLRGITLEESIDSVYTEIDTYNKMFQEGKMKIGIINEDY